MRKVDQDEQILRATKEIVVKFIEMGRLSPTGFPETFKAIYRTVDETVKQAAAPVLSEEAAAESPEAAV